MSGGGLRHGRAALGAAILSLCLSTTAWADGYVSAVSRGAAARDRALETGSVQDWEEALELFAAAVELSPSKEAKFEFAQAASQLHLDDEACGAFVEALELGLAGRAEEQARAFVASHEGAMGTLEIQGPDGARVYVNERKRGVLPLSRPLFVSVGTARVHVDKTGFRPWEREVLIEPRKSQALSPALEAQVEAVQTARPSDPPAQRDEPRADSPPSAPGWGQSLLIAGGAAATVGAAGVVATSLLLTDQRQTLRENCVVLRDDECVATTAGRARAAERAGDTILTLKATRWAALGTALVGVGALAVGVFRLSTSTRPAPPRREVRVDISPGKVSIQWQAEF
jgi:hypothetical protein